MRRTSDAHVAHKERDCPRRLVTLALTNAEGLRSDHLLLHSAATFGYSAPMLMRINASDAVEQASPYNAKIPKALDIMRAEQCSNTVFMMVDAFDCAFVATAQHTLQRFEETGRDVVWAAEKACVYCDGVNLTLMDERARIPAADVHRLRPGRMDCKSSQHVKPTSQPHRNHCLHKHRYLNAGGVIGYRDALINMFEEMQSVRVGGDGWRDRRRVCGEAKGRSCAEQWAALRVLSFVAWEALNVTLDYESRIFYTADWSVGASREHLQAVQPSVIHMTMFVAPRVKLLLRELVDEFVDRKEPPNAPVNWRNSNACSQAARMCAERAESVMAFSRVLTACLVLNATQHVKPIRRLLWSEDPSSRAQAICQWHQESWPSVPLGSANDELSASMKRAPTCVQTSFPRVDRAMCRTLRAIMEVIPTSASDDPRTNLRTDPCTRCDELSHQASINDTSRHTQVADPATAMRNLCNQPLASAFWPEVKLEFSSGDARRRLYAAALGEEKPRWQRNYWSAYPMCFYNHSHRPGLTLVPC